MPPGADGYEDDAMMTPTALAREVISFGPFSLVTSERLLTREGAPVELSARALDILIALLSRPNEVVSKNDLLAQVWPDATVEEGSLRFHIGNLRKALGDGKDGARYITILTGRGYCFVAPISRSSDQGQVLQGKALAAAAVSFPHANLPGRLIGMVGRDDDVLKLSARLNAARFVTIVGSGGVGKTTVAVAVGHHLIEAFSGAVLFVDLSMLNDPVLVATAVASMLGLSVQSADVAPSLIAYLRDKRIFLILDTCEHLIEAVAALASTIFMAAPQVHILATSRETLQVEGEHVYRLDPLACPPDDAGLTAAVAQTFSAPRLFVERAVASGAHLDFSDAEAAIVVAICRKLDGVALAIELAARRVEAADLAVRHATYYRRWLEQAGTDWSTLSTGAERAPHFAGLNNIRAALEWCFGVNDNAEIGVGLAAAAAPRPMKMGTIASLWRYEAAAR
jgi:predicted ATPase/DNA-binding winged helix-turn-helix (wHTH) protein